MSPTSPLFGDGNRRSTSQAIIVSLFLNEQSKSNNVYVILLNRDIIYKNFRPERKQPLIALVSLFPHACDSNKTEVAIDSNVGGAFSASRAVINLSPIS